MKKDKESDLLVCKRNELVEAAYIKNPILPASENIIAHTLYAKVLPNDQDLQSYRFTLQELANLTGLDHKRLQKSIRRINETLVTSLITVIKPKSVMHTTVCTVAEYYPDQGYVEYEIAAKLKPYLLDLKAGYTSYRLEELTKLKSQYSQRLYDLLRQFLTDKELLTCWRQDDVAALRDYMGVQKKYPKFGEFKRSVLDPAVKEINAKTSINCSYETLTGGSGGKVYAIKFGMKNKPKTKNDKGEVLANCQNQTLLLKLKAFLRNISDEVAIQIADNADETLVEGLLLEVMQKQFQGEIKTTPEAYFMGALRNAVMEQSKNSKTKTQ